MHCIFFRVDFLYLYIYFRCYIPLSIMQLSAPLANPEYRVSVCVCFRMSLNLTCRKHYIVKFDIKFVCARHNFVAKMAHAG
jgi:hypothetical protein